MYCGRGLLVRRTMPVMMVKMPECVSGCYGKRNCMDLPTTKTRATFIVLTLKSIFLWSTQSGKARRITSNNMLNPAVNHIRMLG